MFRISSAGACLLALLSATPALAQTNPGMEPAEKTKARVRALYERPVPPSALPGARLSEPGAAPAERPAAEMSPTEALFDAVNRGDVPAARDALSRGADIEQPNVLGLSPLDLAVDLGRNDMTFLLLSMRGAASGARSALAPVPPVTRTAVAAPKPTPAPVRATVERAPVVEQRRPARLAGNAGTPVPQAGFLGFGGGVPQ